MEDKLHRESPRQFKSSKDVHPEESTQIGIAAEPKLSRAHAAEQDKQTYKQEKAAILEADLAHEVDKEFKELQSAPNVGSAGIAAQSKRIVAGLRLNFMNMRDGNTGHLFWESTRFGPDMFSAEMRENIPKEILLCPSVSREINFTSVEEIENFRIEQRIFFQGQCLEEWHFDFGFVIPGSTNSWQQTIEAVPPEQMLPASVLSGNITVESSFLDGKTLLCKNLVRIFYV